MILLNIDVTKIPKEAISSNPNWKGKFLKLKLVDHPKDDNDGFIAVDIPKGCAGRRRTRDHRRELARHKQGATAYPAAPPAPLWPFSRLSARPEAPNAATGKFG